MPARRGRTTKSAGSQVGKGMVSLLRHSGFAQTFEQMGLVLRSYPWRVAAGQKIEQGRRDPEPLLSWLVTWCQTPHGPLYYGTH